MTVYTPPFKAAGIRRTGDPDSAAALSSRVAQAAYRVNAVSSLMGTNFRTCTVMPDGSTLNTSRVGQATLCHIAGAMKEARDLEKEKRKEKRAGKIYFLVVDRLVTSTRFIETDDPMYLPNWTSSTPYIVDYMNNGRSGKLSLGYSAYTYNKIASRTWDRRNLVKRDYTEQSVWEFMPGRAALKRLPNIDNRIDDVDIQVSFDVMRGGVKQGELTFNYTPDTQSLGDAPGMAAAINFSAETPYSIQYVNPNNYPSSGWFPPPNPNKRLELWKDQLYVQRVDDVGFKFDYTTSTWFWRCWHKDPFGPRAREIFDQESAGALSHMRRGDWFIDPFRSSRRVRWRASGDYE